MRQRICRQSARSAFALAAAFATLSATAAHADAWCGYATRDNAVIECGYTTIAGCESAVGKGGMCFIDPDIARNFARTPPAGAPRFLKTSEQARKRG